MTTEEALRQGIGIPIDIRQFSVDGHTINYAVAGSGPPLLLIHGGNFGWGIWYPNIASFAEHFTVYAIDLPGSGRSSRIDYRTLNPEQDLLGVTKHFIKRLELRGLAVVGSSIGGWVALRVALDHPEKIKAIVLVNSVGLADYISTSDRVISFYPLARAIARLFIHTDRAMERFLRGIFYNRDMPLQPEFLAYFLETMRSSHNLLFISRLTRFHKYFNLSSELPRVRPKTLIIWGREDKIVPLEFNLPNFSRIPAATVKIVDEATHLPSLERPAEFNRFVEHFLWM